MSAVILVVSDWERLRAVNRSPVKDREAKSHALRVKDETEGRLTSTTFVVGLGSSELRLLPTSHIAILSCGSFCNGR